MVSMFAAFGSADSKLRHFTRSKRLSEKLTLVIAIAQPVDFPTRQKQIRVAIFTPGASVGSQDKANSAIVMANDRLGSAVETIIRHSACTVGMLACSCRFSNRSVSG